jgi:hypothetical protein
MRRKNRKWVATAVVLYLFVMWSAYRWAINQWLPDGNIFQRLEREAVRRQQAEARTQAEKEQAPPSPTGEARLSAAGPAYVAARYDARRVVFIVASDTESRFSNSLGRQSTTAPAKLSAPAKPSAPLAGLQELWEPYSGSLRFFPEIIQQTRPGDRWWLNVSPDSIVPATIDRVVVAPEGCSLALGFLASVPAGQQLAPVLLSNEYFVIRRSAVESVQPPLDSHIGELSDWKLLPLVAKPIERQLNARMKEEVAKLDARLRANAASPGTTASQQPIGDARPRLREWLRADKGLIRDEGKLDYDVRAFRLTPDGAPRLFVRARWALSGATSFLMTAWFQAGSPNGRAPVLLWADSSWSAAVRDGDAPVSLGDRMDFQTILNEFDADHDGWAELLIHSYDSHGPGGSTSIGLYLYTDEGLVPLKTPLRRTAESAESCLDR